MARKIVAVHGIGKTQPGWSDLLRLDLDIPQEDWIEFNYDDLMDRSFSTKLLSVLPRFILPKPMARKPPLSSAGPKNTSTIWCLTL